MLIILWSWAHFNFNLTFSKNVCMTTTWWFQDTAWTAISAHANIKWSRRHFYCFFWIKLLLFKKFCKKKIKRKKSQLVLVNQCHDAVKLQLIQMNWASESLLLNGKTKLNSCYSSNSSKVTRSNWTLTRTVVHSLVVCVLVYGSLFKNHNSTIGINYIATLFTS